MEEKKINWQNRKEEFISLLESLNQRTDRGIALFLGAEEKTVQVLHGN